MSTTLHRLRGAAVVCLKATEAGEPPSEFRVFPAGSFDTLKGTFLFDEEGAKTLLADRKKRGVDVRVDYEHASVRIEEAKDPAEAGKAAGWFEPELRGGELWAVSVKWTPRAAQALKDGEYRYLSPTFWTEKKTGRIVLLDSVALTNDPATLDAEPLMTLNAHDLRKTSLAMSFDEIFEKLSEAIRTRVNEDAWIVEIWDEFVVYRCRRTLYQCGYAVTGTTITLDAEAVEVRREFIPVEGGKTMKTLLNALRLTDGATEAEALRALSALETKLTAAETKLSELVALTGKATPAEAAGVIAAWKGAADQVTALSTQVTELKAKETEREVVGLVDDAVKAGKAAPAQREVLLSMGRKDPATLRAFLEAAPVIASVASPAKPPSQDGVTLLSAEDKAVAAQMGIELKVLAEQKAKAAQ